jgi:hypothetical protein
VSLLTVDLASLMDLSFLSLQFLSVERVFMTLSFRVCVGYEMRTCGVSQTMRPASVHPPCQSAAARAGIDVPTLGQVERLHVAGPFVISSS